jgi:hypothetical protein
MKVITNNSEITNPSKVQIRLGYSCQGGVFTGTLMVRINGTMEYKELKSIDDFDSHSVSCQRKGSHIVGSSNGTTKFTTNNFSDGVQLVIKQMTKKYLDIADYFDNLDEDQNVGSAIAKGLNEIQTELKF